MSSEIMLINGDVKKQYNKNYTKLRRKKYLIQVNKLRFEINGLQFKTIAKILCLNELKISSTPNLTFAVYNAGKAKEEKQRKIDNAIVNETT